MLVSTHVTSKLDQGFAVDIFYMLPALGDVFLGNVLLFTTYSPTFDSGFGLWDIRVVDCSESLIQRSERANNPVVDKGLGTRYYRHQWEQVALKLYK